MVCIALRTEPDRLGGTADRARNPNKDLMLYRAVSIHTQTNMNLKECHLAFRLSKAALFKIHIAPYTVTLFNKNTTRL